MKTNTTNYQTLIVTFAEPIRVLDNYFDDAEAWGVASLKEWIDGYESTRFRVVEIVVQYADRLRKEWIDGYESTRFTQIGDHTAVITSEYNAEHVQEWLQRHIPIASLISA